MSLEQNIGTTIPLAQSSYGAATVWKSESVFCHKDGTVLQLHSSVPHGKLEWRPLPDFEKASKMFNCTTISED